MVISPNLSLIGVSLSGKCSKLICCKRSPIESELRESGLGTNLNHGHSHGLGSHGHSHTNMNVRAALIHVIGDFIQSVGVFIAGLIIFFNHDYKLADPICTFIFSVLVMFTTLNIMKDAVYVLMEGFPRSLNYEAVKEALENIEGVKALHSLHIWSLTIGMKVKIIFSLVILQCFQILLKSIE